MAQGQLTGRILSPLSPPANQGSELMGETAAREPSVPGANRTHVPVRISQNQTQKGGRGLPPSPPGGEIPKHARGASRRDACRQHGHGDTRSSRNPCGDSTWPSAAC